MKDESRSHGSRAAHREETTVWIRFHAVADGPEGLVTLFPERSSKPSLFPLADPRLQTAGRVPIGRAITAVDDGAAVSESQGVCGASRAMPSSRRAMKGDDRTRGADYRK
jgi:hypothetical protein